MTALNMTLRPIRKYLTTRVITRKGNGTKHKCSHISPPHPTQQKTAIKGLADDQL